VIPFGFNAVISRSNLNLSSPSESLVSMIYASNFFEFTALRKSDSRGANSNVYKPGEEKKTVSSKKRVENCVEYAKRFLLGAPV
jgi:hypothetical protein